MSRKLTQMELRQLLWYAEQIQDEGCYYGCERYFRRRHASIVQWLGRELDQIKELENEK